MKVVLFCGGQGTRLREYSDSVPKPMVPVGYRPILWHVMKYYAHYGHKDFILALGYKADVIKDFFLHYDEAVSNDFVLSEGGKRIDLVNSDIDDWTITFVDTGATSNIGERLRRVQPYLKGEEMFMANYSDGVTDLPLSDYVDEFKQRDKVASFVAVRPPGSYHVIGIEEDGRVTGIEPMAGSRSSTTCVPAKSWFTNRSTDSLVTASSEPTAILASGSRWTPSRISSDSTSSTARGRPRGRSGTETTSPDGRTSCSADTIAFDIEPDHPVPRRAQR